MTTTDGYSAKNKLDTFFEEFKDLENVDINVADILCNLRNEGKFDRKNIITKLIENRTEGENNVED